MRTLFLMLSAALAAVLASCGGGGGAQPRMIAFYGDSITTGTHSTTVEAWTPARWSPTPVQHMAALASFTALDYSRDGASSSDATIIADDSTLVVIRFGVADAVRNMPAAAFAAQITRLVGEARALRKGVLLTGLSQAASVDTRALDGVMRERAAVLGVPFVNVRSLPFAAGADLADPLHPAEGYSRRIGVAVAAAIEGLL